MAAAEGWVVLGRGGMANKNNLQQEQHLLVQFNKKRAEMAAIQNELMEIEMSQRRRMQQQLAMRGQMMYRGIGTPQWVGNNGNQGSGGRWGQRQEDKSLGEMLEELREGSQKYEN